MRKQRLTAPEMAIELFEFLKEFRSRQDISDELGWSHNTITHWVGTLRRRNAVDVRIAERGSRSTGRRPFEYRLK